MHMHIVPGRISRYDRSNYHLLSGTLCQCVPVAKIIDVDISDVVAIGNVNVLFQLGWFCTGRRAGFRNLTGGL